MDINKLPDRNEINKITRNLRATHQLPAQYNDTLSYQGLIYKLAQYIEDTSNNVADWNVWLEDFVSTFDTKLQDTVRNKIQELYDSGKLAELVAQVIDVVQDQIDDVNSRVDTEIINVQGQIGDVDSRVDMLSDDVDTKIIAVQGQIDEEIGIVHSSVDTKINDVDSRLSSQVEQTDNKLNLQSWELNSKGRETQGIAVFISDDSKTAEYTVALPLFASEGIPQTIGVISSAVGRNNSLTKEQLLELQNDYGWEIASHSKSHPLGFPNISDAQAEEELRGSRDDLRSLGLNVNNYLYVGGLYGQREYDLVKKYYRGARNSEPSYGRGVNYAPFGTHEIKTMWIDPVVNPLAIFISNSGKSEGYKRMIAYAKERIDEAKAGRGMLVISTHWGNFDVDNEFVDMYREIIQYAKANLNVTTLNDALDKMANIVEVGQYTQEPARITNKQHFLLGADGSISGSLGVTERDKFTSQTPITHFPFGYTVTPIYYGNRNGFPEDKTGLLITSRQIADLNAFNYQKYITTEGLDEYIRSVDEKGNYGKWTPVNYVNFKNLLGLATPIDDFPFGITYTTVANGDDDTVLSPVTGKGGTLITHRLSDPGYSFQEFLVLETMESYKRKIFGSTWLSWVKVGL